MAQRSTAGDVDPDDAVTRHGSRANDVGLLPRTFGPLQPTVSARLRLPDYLPARMINEFVYCPRLFFYEWVDAIFAHNVDTVEGAQRHEKLERRDDELKSADSLAPEDRVHSRSVQLGSDTHRLIAKIDLVEGANGVVAPVDYKKGAPRDGDGGIEAWPPDKVQVAVQALVLRDNGYACHEGIVYYHETRQRVRVPVDEALVAATLDAAATARRVAESGRIPPPLVDSGKCPRCSLVAICLPDETRQALALVREAAREPQLALFEETADDRATRSAFDTRDDDLELRRLVPARDDLKSLYVTGYAMTMGKKGDVLQIRDRKTVVQEVRINDIAQVNLFGPVTLTGSAAQGLCWAEKPIAHFSFGGWFYGLTQGLGLKNVFLRIEQFRRAGDPAFCLRVAREIVATKIRNQRVLLQRNHVEPPSIVLRRLKELAAQAFDANALDELLGVEGAAARLYFEHFAGMLKGEDESDTELSFDFAGRNRRPPRDPVNALLSLAYSLLAKDLTIICHAIGFDPFVGVYHQPRFGRPALALDLMEGFRPLVADSAVLTAVNTGMVTQRDFLRAGDGVSLTPQGRKSFIRAFEQRMDHLVTHPLFGYRVGYRRVLEIQARLLARVTTGELPRYPGFETR